MNKIGIVAKREYARYVKKPAFWAVTLGLPALMLVLGFISGYSTQVAEKKMKAELAAAKRVIIADASGIIQESLLVGQYELAHDAEQAAREVRTGRADAAIVYPADIASTQKITIYAQDTGLTSRGKYDNLARELLKQSILGELDDDASRALFNANIAVTATHYKLGEEVATKLEDFVMPIASVVVYFLLTFLSTNFLLMSVSEEKENRMMEVILSILTPRQLIWGKIIGLVGLAFTQLVILGGLGIASMRLVSTQFTLPVDLSAVTIDPVQLAVSLFYALCGFLIIATIMVGVGSAMPTYREAQSFSSIFIMLSIFPMYFASLIVSDPNGTVAKLTSYFPLSAPLVLMARNALGELPPVEVAISSVVLVLYVIGGFYLSFKLFELGSLEYSQKVNFKNLLSRK